MCVPQHLCIAGFVASATWRAGWVCAGPAAGPGPFPIPPSLPYCSSAPEALLLCGCQIILGTDCGAVDHWISAQLEGRGGLDLARGSCPQLCLQGINADSQLCIGLDWGHLALLYTGSNLLKFGTPQLRN